MNEREKADFLLKLERTQKKLEDIQRIFKEEGELVKKLGEALFHSPQSGHAKNYQEKWPNVDLDKLPNWINKERLQQKIDEYRKTLQHLNDLHEQKTKIKF